MEAKSTLLENIRNISISKEDPPKRLRATIKEALGEYKDGRAFQTMSTDDLAAVSKLLKNLLSRLFELGTLIRTVQNDDCHVQVLPRILRTRYQSEDALQLGFVFEREQFQLDADQKRATGIGHC